MKLVITEAWAMENKNKIEIGYLEVFSWENFSVTNSRYCSDVEQLKWILPTETTELLDKFLTLWQETLLQDCNALSPLRDGGNKERIIYVKSKSFKKRLKNESIVFLKKLPLSMLMFNATGDPIDGVGNIFFPASNLFSKPHPKSNKITVEPTAFSS